MNENWLDPEQDDVDVPAGAAVRDRDLVLYAHRVLGEPLVAQRLLSARREGLDLRDGSEDSEWLQYWGHTFASAIAVLMPLPSSASPAERRKRRKYQEQLLKSQVGWPDLASTSTSAFLLCADSHPSEIGLPHQLYPRQDDAGLLDFDGFDPLVQTLIRTVSPNVEPAWSQGLTGWREALGTIVAETFKNTHDHARQEIDKSDVANSVRGIYARYYSVVEIIRLSQECNPEQYSPALHYAHSFIPKPNPPGVRTPSAVEVDGVLEITVFDSGPGMAAKWLERTTENIPVKEQLEALLSCFAKGRTTTGTGGRGFGLAKVLLKLKELHGFISVRSNEVHVYREFTKLRDLAMKVMHDGHRVPEEKLFDWRHQYSSTPTRRAPVEGTVVSFLLPMGSQ